MSIAIATCGNCNRSWDENKDPTPSALCHFCHGRGYSDFEIDTDDYEGSRAHEVLS